MKKTAEGLISIFIIIIVGMMVIPLPPGVLDILIAANFSLAIAIMLLTMYIKEPLDFSVFPSLLLVMTLFRLSLNVSSTRLILLKVQAGKIIEAFGNFVIGGNEVVGLVVFLILVIIQFVVITKGAERVAEVAARFTLDAMPGKQMSIDADLNAGLITEDEARKRRSDIEREADFYGAMDGASKFVKGDAIAGLIITAVNLLGGLGVGMLQHGLPLQEAWHRYALLTVGDGLVSQLPALIISSAMGIIVTRSTSRENLGQDLSVQMTSSPKVLNITGASLIVLSLVPGLPKLPLLILGGIWFLIGVSVRKTRQEEEREKKEESYKKELEGQKNPEAAFGLIKVDPLEIEFGLALLPIADPSQGGDLLDRIVMVRRQLASELGILIPVVRVRDNFGGLGPNSYCINLRGVEIGSGQVYPDRLMAIPGSSDRGQNHPSSDIKGIPGLDPAFGLEVLWVPKEERDLVESKGYTVIEASAVIATHLTELLKKHGYLLLTRQEVDRLLSLVKEEDASCVEEVIPNLLSVGDVQKVLQGLLKEGIPVRDLVSIMENLADAAKVSKDEDYLTMRVREGLKRLITKEAGLDKEMVSVACVDPSFEEEVLRATKKGDRGSYVALPADRLTKMLKAISDGLSEVVKNAGKPVLLTSSATRSQFKEIASRAFPDARVIAYEELDDNAKVRAEKVIRCE